MNYRFEDFLLDFEYQMLANSYYVDVISQKDLYDLFDADWEIADGFPMISYEETPDSDYHTSLQSSCFLNDLSYNDNCKWVTISRVPDGIVGIMCISDNYYDTLKIEVFEVNMICRGFGYSRKILSAFESAVEENKYERIEVKPYDSQSTSYWEHMGYIRNEKGVIRYVKNI